MIISGDVIGSNFFEGSGNVVIEERDIPVFRAVDASGSVNLVLKSGPFITPTIEGEDNIISLVNMEVRAGILFVGFKDNISINHTKPITIRATVPVLESLELSGAVQAKANGITGDYLKIRGEGAGKIDVSHIHVKKLVLKSSGASKITISGDSEEMDADISGASKLDASDLIVKNASLYASGATKASVHIVEKIRVEASGASKVEVQGNPPVRQDSVSGASKLKFV